MSSCSRFLPLFSFWEWRLYSLKKEDQQLSVLCVYLFGDNLRWKRLQVPIFLGKKPQSSKDLFSVCTKRKLGARLIVYLYKRPIFRLQCEFKNVFNVLKFLSRLEGKVPEEIGNHNFLLHHCELLTYERDFTSDRPF